MKPGTHWIAFEHGCQPRWPAVWKRPDQRCIHKREKCHARANTQAQHQNCGACKEWILQKLSECITQIGPDRGYHEGNIDAGHFLLSGSPVSKPQECVAARFPTRHPGSEIFLIPHLDVRCPLLVDLLIDTGAKEEIGYAANEGHGRDLTRNEEWRERLLRVAQSFLLRSAVVYVQQGSACRTWLFCWFR